MTTLRKLPPIKERPDEWEPIELEISKIFRSQVYLPLVKAAQMQTDVIANAKDPDALLQAIMTGRIVHSRGYFTGRFNSAISRALKGLGAEWDRRQGSFKISISSLPTEYARAVRLADDRFKQVLRAVDNKLADMLPDQIVEMLSLEKHVDRSIFRMQKDLDAAIRGVSIAPSLTPERLATIAREYNDNMKLEIKNWTTAEIASLRERVQAVTFAGNRYEGLQKVLQKSYGASRAKAKFIARQETNLLLASYKKSRLLDAGLPEYEWCCVHASPDHPVRPMHWALRGKIFRWDDPPIVNEKGEKKNPGEDFGCRCYARPVVRF